MVHDGKPLSWDNAMRLFVDRSGLPGPRGWSNQAPPDGRADHPVTGVSWYEASAYAAFRGHSLPTVFQWQKAAHNGTYSPTGVTMPWGVNPPGEDLTTRANFGGPGTLPVTSLPHGMSPFGALHMAGNVAEWTRNDSREGPFAVGGGWTEPAYMFAQFGPRPGTFSSDALGFRLARLAAPGGREGAEPIPLDREVPRLHRQLRRRVPPAGGGLSLRAAPARRADRGPPGHAGMDARNHYLPRSRRRAGERVPLPAEARPAAAAGAALRAGGRRRRRHPFP